MYLTGFADEASKKIEEQIRATRELGWRYIESRGVEGGNIHDVSDEEFEKVCAAFEGSGVAVNCFGSTIMNWGKQITTPREEDPSFAEAERAIPRMQRLGTKLVRVMSYAVLKDRGPDDQMQQERFARMREIVQKFLDAGIQPVHENCMNYGGMGWSYTEHILENVPGLKLVFDTGNPVFSDDLTKDPPYPKQSAWEFYRHVKEHIAYVHIKDGTIPRLPDGSYGKTEYTWPGEGDGDIERIVADLIERGYDGGFSMEPHMGVVFHEEKETSEDEARIRTYIEYGRRFEKLLAACGANTATAE